MIDFLRKLFFLSVALLLTGCTNGATPADIAAALQDARGALVETGQIAATQPGGKPIVHAANEGVKVIDKAAPVLANAGGVIDDVAALRKTVTDLAAANATLADRVAAGAGAAQGTIKIIHDVAPGTPVDSYGQLINAGIILASLAFGHRTATKAITTPGTTVAAGGDK